MNKYIIKVEEIVEAIYVSNYEVEAENEIEAKNKFLNDKFECKFIDTHQIDSYIVNETIVNIKKK